METLLSNTACFLNDRKWLNLIQRAVLSDEALVKHKDLMAMLWAALTIAPRLFRDATAVIMAPSSTSWQDREKVVEELLVARESLIQWQALAESHAEFPSALEQSGERLAVRWPSFSLPERGSTHNLSLAMYGTYAMCRIFKARLLYALNPARFHNFEDECQTLASRVTELSHRPNDEQRWNTHSLFMSQSTWIAKGILETREMWKADTLTGNGAIEKWKFEAWCSSIGRHIS